MNMSTAIDVLEMEIAKEELKYDAIIKDINDGIKIRLFLPFLKKKIEKLKSEYEALKKTGLEESLTIHAAIIGRPEFYSCIKYDPCWKQNQQKSSFRWEWDLYNPTITNLGSALTAIVEEEDPNIYRNFDWIIKKTSMPNIRYIHNIHGELFGIYIGSSYQKTVNTLEEAVKEIIPLIKHYEGYKQELKQIKKNKKTNKAINEKEVVPELDNNQVIEKPIIISAAPKNNDDVISEITRRKNEILKNQREERYKMIVRTLKIA
ncbi:Uncharacterised protein [Candidatus Tiddalikarchaeum anstoanum]|nr:Uncharacterised protein [Candidatus Tiddalikarchaeum anstoanum]